MASPTTSTDTASAVATKSPWALYKERLEAVKAETEASGSMLVRGYQPLSKADGDHDDDEEEEDNEEEEVDPNSLTQAQVDHMRRIMMTKKRIQFMEEMEELVLGDQYGSSMLCFSTSFSWQLLGDFETLKRKYKSAKTWPVKLNLLLGFTVAIHQHDVWMHDHECGWEGHKMLSSLARLWKNTLKKSNDELDIDDEFTRPGLVELLRTFKKEVEAIDTYDEPPMKFKFE